MQIRFSKFQHEHINECADLYCKTYNAEPWNENWQSTQPIVEFLSAHLANNYFIGFVAHSNNQMLAASIGFKKPWNQGVEYYIDEYFIHPQYQRQGIGQLLMRHIETQCQAEGLNAVILNTERGYPSELFYKKNGFEEHEGLIILSKVFETSSA
ncbi:GNAT family N-acetyltransferase [Acinetobacter sp. WCHA55]|jgi:aminoglycoside 6'-N-acetyltransferase I|uniref:GNAT family N-acetyltransferase n=1 Tax=Acinetobacter sp. WCHA55 TaxID=2004646 RepID=UPI000B3C0C01|nr:GNAT family N-acetyltransferase [Acinetobacter sp. WCHA55]AYA68841.1 GNAT family N-acetyltransferase [Acinetobacter sp. WCHA55]